MVGGYGQLAGYGAEPFQARLSPAYGAFPLPAYASFPSQTSVYGSSSFPLAYGSYRPALPASTSYALPAAGQKAVQGNMGLSYSPNPAAQFPFQMFGYKINQFNEYISDHPK